VVGKLAVLVDSSKIGERAGMLFSQAGQIDVVPGIEAVFTAVGAEGDGVAAVVLPAHDNHAVVFC
jgi:hypothetical protein